jgi:hypothetical protein
MAAEAIVRFCIDGKRPVAGARAAAGELGLADYDALFADRKIFAGLREQTAETAPLYKRLLGDAWRLVPEPLHALHDLNSGLVAEGRATVERGNGFVARWIAALFGFPPAGVDVPVCVTFRRDGAREIWQRDFAGRRFSSIQEEGRGAFERLLCERFGPFAFGLALVLESGRLKLIVRGWTLFGIPMPLALAPGGEAFESAEDGRFNFHVEIGHRFTGQIVRYRGWLAPRNG